MNLPALTTTPDAMARAPDRVNGAGTSDLVGWAADESILAIVGCWPARFRTARAQRMGLRVDPSFDDVIAEYLVHRRVGAPA